MQHSCARRRKTRSGRVRLGLRATNYCLKCGSQSSTGEYDIFMSHSFADAELILALKTQITAIGLSVYIDWLEDPSLDRGNVTPETARLLRSRMQRRRSLVYATSDSAATSKWMPWELGYFDAFRQSKVAVLPISVSQTSTNSWRGREYLGLYPYITRDSIAGSGVPALWARLDESTYVEFREWLQGTDPTKRG